MSLVLPEHGLALPDRQHGLRVDLNAPNGFLIGAAPVEVHPTVVILEHIGIPEVEGAGEGLERLCQRIGAGVEGAGLSPPGGAEHHPSADGAHIRGVVVNGQLRGLLEFPGRQVIGVPEAPGHGCEQIISVIEQQQRGIRRLPRQGVASHKTGAVLIAVF